MGGGRSTVHSKPAAGSTLLGPTRPRKDMSWTCHGTSNAGMVAALKRKYPSGMRSARGLHTRVGKATRCTWHASAYQAGKWS